MNREALKDVISKAIADAVGNGMREKYERHAEAVMSALSKQTAQEIIDSKGRMWAVIGPSPEGDDDGFILAHDGVLGWVNAAGKGIVHSYGHAHDDIELVEPPGLIINLPSEWPSDADAKLRWICDITSDPEMSHTKAERARIHKYTTEVCAALQSLRPPAKPDADLWESRELGADERYVGVVPNSTPDAVSVSVDQAWAEHRKQMPYDHADNFVIFKAGFQAAHRHARQVPDEMENVHADLPPGYRMASRDGDYWPLFNDSYATNNAFPTRELASLAAWKQAHEKLDTNMAGIRRLAAPPATEKE